MKSFNHLNGFRGEPTLPRRPPYLITIINIEIWIFYKTQSKNTRKLRKNVEYIENCRSSQLRHG